MATADSTTLYPCTDCQQRKTRDEFYNSRGRSGQGFKAMPQCKPCYNKRTHAYKNRKWSTDLAFRQKTANATRRASLKRNFGITEEQYEAMFVSQGGVCAICRQKSKTVRGGRVCRLAVDHDHRTGKVRQLLCTVCNTMVGIIEKRADQLAACAAYVDRHKTT